MLEALGTWPDGIEVYNGHYGIERALAAGTLRAVLAHELAHLRRRDPLQNALVAWLAPLWWPNPRY